MLMLKRSCGIFLLLMGFIGVAACVLGVYKCGSVGEELRRMAERSFHFVEKGLEDARTGTEKLTLSMSQTETDLERVIAEVREFQKDPRGGQREAVGSAPSLDSDLEKKFHKVQMRMEDALQAAEALKHLLMVVDGSGLAKKIGIQVGSLSIRVQKTAGDLRKLYSVGVEATQIVRDLQHDPHSEHLLSKLAAQLVRIERGLPEVHALKSEFLNVLQQIEATFNYYEEKISWWIHVGNVAFPLLLVWMGLGQIALMVLGGRLMRKGSAR